MDPSRRDVGFLASGLRTKKREARTQEVCSDCASSAHLLFALVFEGIAAPTMDTSRGFAQSSGRNRTQLDTHLAGSSHGGLVSMYAKLIAAQRGSDAKNAASAAWW
jgi:hypothetical protein